MNLQGGFDRLGYRFLNVQDAMSESPKKSFLGPGKFILLLLLGLVVYGVTLVFWVPAGWLWHKASGHIQLPPQVQVQQVQVGRNRQWAPPHVCLRAGEPTAPR